MPPGDEQRTPAGHRRTVRHTRCRLFLSLDQAAHRVDRRTPPAAGAPRTRREPMTIVQECATRFQTTRAMGSRYGSAPTRNRMVTCHRPQDRRPRARRRLGSLHRMTIMALVLIHPSPAAEPIEGFLATLPPDPVLLFQGDSITDGNRGR